MVQIKLKAIELGLAKVASTRVKDGSSGKLQHQQVEGSAKCPPRSGASDRKWRLAEKWNPSRTKGKSGKEKDMAV